MKYYLKALKNYAVFNGRATRSELWFFILFNFIFAIIAAVLDNIFGTTFPIMDSPYWHLPWEYGYIYMVYCIFIILPSLALEVRRLHDVGKSGWFILISLIPLVGAIWLLILFCTKGNSGDNNYGPDPLSGSSGIDFPSNADTSDTNLA